MDYELSDIESRILDSLFFVETFQNIVKECGEKPAVVGDVLEQLIHKKFVAPMKWDDEKSDYVRSFIYDRDDLSAYAYLATKEGLMILHGR